MTELERELVALRGEIAWPPTPDLAGRVAERISAAPASRAPRLSFLPPRLVPVAVAVLLAVLVFGTVLAVSPDVRATLRDWLGLGAVEVRRVDRLPDLSTARDLGLGRRTTLAAARRATGLPLPERTALGAPDAVYLDRARIPSGAVTLVYLARPGLPRATAGIGALLTLVRGEGLIYAEKLIAGGVPIERVRVRGAPGIFVAGDHAVLFAPERDEPIEVRPRLARNTLIWQEDGVTYRLESALGRDAALRLAESAR